jgi:hypothetical protein
MDSGWFHDSSSHPAFGYLYLRRVVVFHHQSLPKDRSAYVKEVGDAIVYDDLGATITGGTCSGGDVSSDVVWLEYTRDHTSVY